MDYTFEKMRKKYRADDIGVYLNTPANGLMRKDIEDQIHLELGPHLLKGSLGFMYFIEELFPKVKSELAHFINSKPADIALMPNFSFAHLGLLSGIPKSTKIGLIREDYPSIMAPFEQGKYEISVLDLTREGLDYNRLREFCKSIEILAISHVQFLSGFKIDLKQVSQICRELDVFLMLDVTQSIGYTEIDVLGDDIDVVAGSCYKWLGAGYGTGFMSVSERFQQRFKAEMGGFLSYRMTDEGVLQFENSMVNYEPGNLNPENYARLLHCLKEKTAIGIKNIENHNSSLVLYALDALKDKGIELPDNYQDEERGAFARIPGNEEIMKQMENQKIYVALRGGNLRFGCHIYNNQEDINQFLEAYFSLTGNS